MKNFSKREKKLLNLTIIIIVIAFILNFVFIPFKNLWVSLNKEIEAKEMALEKYSDLAERGKNQGPLNFYDTKKYKSEVDVLNDIFSLIDKMSSKSSVNLVSIRPDGKDKRDEITKYRIEVKVEGSFKNILKFIESASKTNSNFLVEELDIAKSSQTNALSARILISKLVII